MNKFVILCWNFISIDHGPLNFSEGYHLIRNKLKPKKLFHITLFGKEAIIKEKSVQGNICFQFYQSS